MKTLVIKSLVTLTLALTLVVTGAAAEGNYGVSTCADCPFGNIVPEN